MVLSDVFVCFRSCHVARLLSVGSSSIYLHYFVYAVCMRVAKVVFCFGSFSVVVGCCTLSRLFRSFTSCFSLFPIFKLTSVVQLVSFSEEFLFCSMWFPLFFRVVLNCVRLFWKLPRCLHSLG